MNRAELVEKAARASHQWGLDFGGEHAEWDALRESTRREYRDEAAAVVDVLLPQVTTVEELEALPEETLLVSRDGDPWRWYEWRNASRVIADCGPLTVVWSPS